MWIGQEKSLYSAIYNNDVNKQPRSITFEKDSVNCPRSGHRMRIP